jgi:hypothetical protein
VQANFQLIEGWCDQFEAMNPGSFAKLRLTEAGRYESVTCVPRALVHRMVHGGGQAIQLDCAFMKNTLYKGQMMLACGRDAQGHIVPFGMKICMTVRACVAPPT